MGGTRKSLKKPCVYDALRRKGYSKTKAAKISNAMAKRQKQGRKQSKGRRSGKR